MVSIAQAEIVIIAILAGSLCSIFGSVILLQKNVYLPLTISQSTIFGFALGFFISTAFSSLPLIILASLVSIGVLILVSKFSTYYKISHNEISIALASFVFAIGVFIIRLYSFNKFTEDDRIFTGELVYTTFNKLYIFGTDMGSISLYLFIILFIINIFLIYLYYYQLKAYMFDRDYATTIWINTKRLDIIIMVMVSITVASSIHITGAFMISAFILGPAAISYFFVKRISSMIISSIFICFVSSLSGIKIATAFNITIVSAIVMIIAILFFLAFLLAPETGFVYYYIRKTKVANSNRLKALLLYLYYNKDNVELNIDNIADYFALSKHLGKKTVRQGVTNQDIIVDSSGSILLTDTGRSVAIDIINKIRG